MKTSLFILCWIFIIFCSCKKNSEKPEPPYYPLPEGFLDYAKFTVGDYFLYRDSATDFLDSIVVTKSILTKKVLLSGGGCGSLGCSYFSYYSDELDQDLIALDSLGHRQNWLKTTSTTTETG